MNQARLLKSCTKKTIRQYILYIEQPSSLRNKSFFLKTLTAVQECPKTKKRGGPK
jgi:hypothetical protein